MVRIADNAETGRDIEYCCGLTIISNNGYLDDVVKMFEGIIATKIVVPDRTSKSTADQLSAGRGIWCWDDYFECQEEGFGKVCDLFEAYPEQISFLKSNKNYLVLMRCGIFPSRNYLVTSSDVLDVMVTRYFPSELMKRMSALSNHIELAFYLPGDMVDMQCLQLEIDMP